MGWFTIYSYYLVGLLSLIVSVPRVIKARASFWCISSFLLLVLGYCRDSDMLAIFPAVGRKLFESYGIIEQHRLFQALIMLLMLVIGILFFRKIYRLKLRSLYRNEKMAALGLSYLIMFVIQKSISLHQFGSVLTYRIINVRVEWIAELLGIYWILFWLIVDNLDIILLRKQNRFR